VTLDQPAEQLLFIVDTLKRSVMETRVKKWGNSLALRIPALLAAELGLADDSPVELSLAGGALVVSPLHWLAYDLQELLSQVAEENRHGEVDAGPMAGLEAG
jgi:antitoxin MazE